MKFQWAANRGARVPRAYTLIEVLVVVVVLGTAGAMIVPSLAHTGALRVQGAIRSVVADISVAQSDAIAFQQGRGIVFSCGTLAPNHCDPTMVIAEVNGGSLDLEFGTISERHFGGAQYGFPGFDNINLPNGMLVFDELGGPVVAPGSDEPAPSGSLEISGSNQRFRIDIEGYTGRVTVVSLN